MLKSSPVSLVSLLALSIFIGASCPQECGAKAKEFLKYFNPIPEKTYLNESQDRVIKKKKFKSVAIEGAKPVSNKEVGLFAWLDDKQAQDDKLVEELLAKPEVNGLSALFTWAELEPEEDTFKWEAIDKLVNAASKAGKSVVLRISTAGVDRGGEGISDSPKWVLDSDIKKTTYVGADGKEHTMPIFWDKNYLAKWSNFIQELGDKYDKNPAIHSIGITGGGLQGGTGVVPHFSPDKKVNAEMEKKLVKEHGMNQRQLVEHWKYVADMFPKAFPTARLNFDVNPPTPNKAGQNTLDEITDYLIYRYGQRVYLTRQNVKDGKHGFDDYRVLLKFHPDTFTGYQMKPGIVAEDITKIANFAPEDGITFVELPASLLASPDKTMAAAIEQLRARLGYQLVSQKVTVPSDVKSGAPIKASFTFVNVGAAAPMKPSRQFDKDVASSYKVQLELRDGNGKPVVQSLHTPGVPTNQWTAGRPITWEEELKMPKLKAGQYSVWMSLIDQDTKRKIQILDGSTSQPKAEYAVAVGNIKVSED